MADKLLIADGWKMILVADSETKELRVSVGHPQLEAIAHSKVALSDLSTGVIIDIKSLMNAAMGIQSTTKEDGT